MVETLHFDWCTRFLAVAVFTCDDSFMWVFVPRRAGLQYRPQHRTPGAHRFNDTTPSKTQAFTVAITGSVWQPLFYFRQEKLGLRFDWRP